MVSAPAWPRKRADRCSPADEPRAASDSRSSEPPRRHGQYHGKAIGSFTFGARQRLRSKAEFEHVYKSGQRYQQKLFQVAVCRNDLGWPRLGLSIAARAVGNSVSRNRIRRVIREVFRHRQDLPSGDLVISARSQARHADNAQLRADLEQLLNTVCERCARSPQSS